MGGFTFLRFGKQRSRRAAQHAPGEAPKPGESTPQTFLDGVYLFDIRGDVESVMREHTEAASRAGPVTRLADMTPEKQAEMRRLYRPPGKVTP